MEGASADKKQALDPRYHRAASALIGQLIGYNFYRCLGAKRWQALAISNLMVRLGFIQTAIEEQHQEIQRQQVKTAITNIFNTLRENEKADAAREQA